jgi:hypothetical protein
MDGSSESTVSYARDIRPLFRDRDVNSMRTAKLDLASYDEVSARADAILEKLAAGKMPCDGAWPEEQVELFRRWISDGKKA